MQKIIIGIIIVLVIGIVIYYVTSNKSKNSPTTVSSTSLPANPATNTPIQPQPPATPKTPPVVPVSKTSTAPALSEATVSIKNFSFIPATLNAKVGTKVTWVNDDTIAHTVTSDTGDILNSGTIDPGQSFSYTFTNSISINYHCSIHPMMRGNVVIEK